MCFVVLGTVTSRPVRDNKMEGGRQITSVRNEDEKMLNKLKNCLEFVCIIMVNLSKTVGGSSTSPAS